MGRKKEGVRTFRPLRAKKNHPVLPLRVSSISDVVGLSSALENVQPTDINISDVTNLQTSLDGKQTNITDNSYLSISDVSGLSSALENVQPTDINISNVTNLESTLVGKQDLITINDNLI